MTPLVLVLALSSAPGAQAGAPTGAEAGAPADALAPAVDAWAKKDPAACEDAAESALSRGGLSVDDTARAWVLRGACYALAGDADRAERCYAVALRIRHDAKGPDGAAPADPAFAAALKALPPPDRSLAARAVAAVDDVKVELLVDDLQMVKSARLVHAGEDVAGFPLDAAAAHHEVKGVSVEGLTLVLVDKHGNALLSQPVIVEQRTGEHVITPKPGSGSEGKAGDVTVLTTLGVTALGAGLIGIVTSGIAVAGYGPKALDEGQLWLVGVGASTGLFLVGASLVVVDQGLGPG